LFGGHGQVYGSAWLFLIFRSSAPAMHCRAMEWLDMAESAVWVWSSRLVVVRTSTPQIFDPGFHELSMDIAGSFFVGELST
jgi:hypothetical protein